MKHEGLSPAERAAGVYAGRVCGRTFREDVEAHMLHGYVFSTPEVFVLARPVWSGASAEEVRDPWRVFARGEQDAWFVYLLAGDFSAALAWVPYELPLIGWERAGKNGVRYWRMAEFGRRVRGSQISSIFTD